MEMRHGYRKPVIAGETMKRRGFFKAVGAMLFGGLVAEAKRQRRVKPETIVVDSLQSLGSEPGVIVSGQLYCESVTGWFSVNDIRRLERRRTNRRRL